LTPKQKRNLSKIIPFGIIWGLFGFLYLLIEYGILGDAKVYPSTNNPYDFKNTLLISTPATFFMGILLGTIEVLFLNKLFVRRTFGEKILFKTGLYLGVIFILVLGSSFITSSLILERSIFHPQVVHSIAVFIGNFVFWSIVIYAGVIIMLSLFFSEVLDYLGENAVSNFFMGKYHHPREENRIFMFLDMKSSTTIAEQLGHVEYFRLLNKYYTDTTEAIIQTSGEIYQYVGDEIIVSWNLKKGLASNNCIRCFFMIKETFSTLSDRYIESFGLIPKFKAGFHYGKVTTGEIGVLKKEIFFTGDVLNTTARIQASCNEYETDLLISEELISRLDINDTYDISAIGECELKGRNKKINLFSITNNK